MDGILGRIDKLRREQKISQKYICGKLSISESSFDSWKKGKHDSYRKYLPEIAEILGCSVEFLISGESSKAEDFYRKFQALPNEIRNAIEILMDFDY